jgi:hypothetical protein
MNARIGIIALLIIVIAGALIGSAVLAANPAFIPGDALFSLQRFAEQAQSAVQLNPTNKLNYLLQVLDRRIQDLGTLTGKPAEIQALAAANESLDQVLLAGAVLSPRDKPSLILDVIQRTDSFLAALAKLTQTAASYPQTYKAMHDKLLSLSQLLRSDGMTADKLTRVVGIRIVFPPEANAVQVLDSTGSPNRIAPRHFTAVSR